MNIIDVSYELEEYSEIYEEQRLVSLLNAIFDLVKVDNVECSCSLVTDQTMQELNTTWRGKNESTDILTFAQEEGVEWPEGELRILGDIIISPDFLKRNSEYFMVDKDEELLRLLIHGVLHLLGEDHETNDSTEPMLLRQEQLLVQLRR